MASLGSLVGHGSGADSERQRWSSNLGGVGRGDRRWELREEAHRFLCRTEGKRKKRKGQVGAAGASGQKRGVRRACGVGARPTVARPRRRRAAVGRPGLNRGGNGVPKSGPGGYSARRRWKISFKIKFQTDSNHIQILSNFDSSKKDPFD
jgi:hypothetical protein